VLAHQVVDLDDTIAHIHRLLSRVLTYNIIKVNNFGVTNHGRRVRFNQVDLTIQWIT